MKKVKQARRQVGAGAAVALALVAMGCGAGRIEDTAPVQLVIVDLEGVAGALDGTPTDVLISDVMPVFPDYAVATLRNVARNPYLADDDLIDRGTVNNIVLERYEVRYLRTDGRNVEGQDVPYGFAGPLAQVVDFDDDASVGFLIVRYQAKEEAPLRNLRLIGGEVQGGGEDLITAYAEITIHGRTFAGKAVVATGRLEVHFGDFADTTT